MGDDEGEVADPVPTLICTEELVDVFDDGLSLDGIVEFAEEGDGFLSTRLADAVAGVEEEVVAGICGGCDGIVQDGEVADAGEDEVLADGGGGG